MHLLKLVSIIGEEDKLALGVAQISGCVLVVVRVWNEAAAHRLTTMGHSVRRGDLVWLRQGQNKMEDARETSMAQVRRQIKQKKIF